MARDSAAIDLYPIGHPLAEGMGPAWATEWGDDDDFGPFALLELPFEKDPRKTACQRWRYVPPGTFLMGSADNEQGRDNDEGPRHEVGISQGFWIGDTPCTQDFWESVMGNNPSRFKDGRRPVESVSWDDVRQFLHRLNERVPQLRASLPTEAQWEYACRAGSLTPIYPTGSAMAPWKILGQNNVPALDPIAWYGGNSGVDFELSTGADSSKWPEKQYPHKRAGTHPVAKKLPNLWGLYDMLGNVWEWCADGRRKYTADPVEDPVGPMDVGSRCVRGGSWDNFARSVRCACRIEAPPEHRLGRLGFRLVRVQDGS